MFRKILMNGKGKFKVCERSDHFYHPPLQLFTSCLEIETLSKQVYSSIATQPDFFENLPWANKENLWKGL